MENDWTKVLGFPGYRVYKQEIDEEHKHLKLWIRRKRGNRSLICAGCGRRVHQMHEVYDREIRDLPVFEYQSTVVVELYRVNCPVCGVKAEKVPQLPSKSPYSKRFEDAVGQACESASARQVARRMGLAESTVRGIDLRYLERCQASRRPPPLRHMGVDELYQGKKDKFLTVVCNRENAEPFRLSIEEWVPDCKIKNCPIQDEPEMKVDFQWTMSLKTPVSKGAAGRCMLRVDEHHHAEFGTIELVRNEGVRRGKPEGLLLDGREGGDVWLHRRNAKEPAVSEAEQRTKRYCAPVSGEGDRSQPGADDAPGGALDEAAVHPTAGGGEEAAIRAALYGRGHPAAGLGRQRPRGSIGAGSPAHLATGVCGFRQAGVPEPGRHFGVAHLQSPGLENLRECAGAHNAHPGAPGVHRRAAETGPAGATRLSAGGHGAPGSPRWQARGIPHQRGRYGDAMAGGGLRGDHQRKPPGAGVGEHAPPISVPHLGLSLRQRIGVYQSAGGPDAEQVIGGVHQITGLPDHRQRSGGGQKRSGGAQAYRLRPHRERACRSLAEVLHRLLQPLSELSSAVRICHGGHRSTRQAQTPLPGERLPHSLRKIGVAEEVEGILEARDNRGSAGAAVQRTQRYRSGTAHAEGQTGIVGQMPEHAAMSRTTRRLPLVGIERQRVGWQKSNPKKSWRLQVGRASRWSAPSIGGRAGKKNHSKKSWRLQVGRASRWAAAHQRV